MAIATELTINTAASALDMAEAIFGSGIQVTGATFSGPASGSSGIYSGAQTTTPGIVPGDSGVILSTGQVANFTNSDGSTNTNTAAGTSTNTTGIDNDAQLNAIAGRATFDGAILNATFIPDGDFLTMQFVFTSEEYPEYVGSNFNDAFGVWVNGNFVPMTITTTGEVAINTVNGTSNQNLYHDNTADQYNTEMDGFTRVLSFKAPVNAGQVNTIKIGIADAGDTAYDSNLLIAGDSIQTIALAFDDDIQLLANSSRTFDILANDNDQTDGGLTITHLNDVAVVPGQTVTLATGEQIRLNADGTVTVFSDGDAGSTNLTHSIIDSAGNTDVGFITINTVAALTRDGIIEGTAGADVIQVGYLGDPDGDLVDSNDALGVGGTTGDGDYILAGAGNDSIVSGNGNDVIYAGADNDTVFGGAGDDLVGLGAGNDSFGSFGTDSAGNDTVYGDAGADYIIGGAGLDRLYGGTGNDTLSGGAAADSVYGGDGADVVMVADDHEADLIDGGSGGTDTDTLGFANALTTEGVTVTYTGTEAGSYAFAATPSGLAQGTGTFTEIEAITLTDSADTVDGAANTTAMTLTGNGGADVLTGGTAADTLLGGADGDTLSGNGGADSLNGGDGADSLLGGQGDDTLSGGAGGDTLQGGEGADLLAGSSGLDLADYSTSGAAVSVDLSTLTASGGDAAGDTIYGSVDGIIGSAFDDTLTGADGESTLAADAYTTVIHGGGGNDIIDGRAGADSLYGGTGADTITSGSGADVVEGGDDADRILGGAGDTVDGGEGGAVDDDTLTASDVYSVAFDPANSENGTITFVDNSTLTFRNIENLILNGGTPDGVVWGTDAGQVMDVGYVDANGDIIDGGDAIFAGAAPDDDEVFGLGGSDTITSGLGDDDVYGGDANDQIASGAGNDYAQGDAGDDTLDGGADDDFLRGDAGNDQVFGGVGNDTVYGGADNDVVDAGTGNDNAFGGYGSDVVYGGDGSDTITGSGGDDQVYGGDGDDMVQGSDGADTLYGGLGADTLLGEEDGDVIHAGAGDYVDGYESVTTGVDLDKLHVTDVAQVSFDPFLPENGVVTFNDGGTLNFYNIEQVYVDGVLYGEPDYLVEGSAANDLIDAAYAGDLDGDLIDAADNQTGADGDVVLAGAGNDTVLAGQGDDSVLGEDGDDLLFGGAGGDTLTGGEGADTLDGGADRDVILGAADDVVDGGEDGDDFDTLDLRGAGSLTVTYDADNPENGTVEFRDTGRTLDFHNIENVIPCFTPGSRVLTVAGEVPVQDLRPGDRVLTRDNGFQEIRWMARRDLIQTELRRNAGFNPVRIAKGALGDGLPDRDLVVSPQHRMLMTGPRTELLFGEREVLVAATHLIGMAGVTRIFPIAISYIHFMFDAHEVVRADGAWSESFQPGEQTVAGLAEPQRAELLALFPDVLNGVSHCAARLSLKAREATVLLRA